VRIGADVGLAMNPEFLREGVAVSDFLEPDRIVVGGVDERTLDVLSELYAVFADTPLLRVDPRTAEMVKYTANALLATLISFSNEIGNLCAEIGTDVTEVLAGVHLDRRLVARSSMGCAWSLDILSYLAAGCGFGGSCFPKDVKALVAHGAARGRDADAALGLRGQRRAARGAGRAAAAPPRSRRTSASPCSGPRSSPAPTTCASPRL
jgi:UDPglucose 6-dehydrogenase